MDSEDSRRQRVNTLVAQVRSAGLGDGYGWTSQGSSRDEFSQSDVPGICRTCANAMIFQEGEKEPTVLCRIAPIVDADGTPFEVPRTLTKCSSFRVLERTDSLESMVDRAVLIGPRPGIWAREFDPPSGDEPRAGFRPAVRAEGAP